MPEVGKIYKNVISESDFATIIQIVSCKKHIDKYVIDWKFIGENKRVARKWTVTQTEFEEEWRALSPVEREMYEF